MSENGGGGLKECRIVLEAGIHRGLGELKALKWKQSAFEEQEGPCGMGWNVTEYMRDKNGMKVLERKIIVAEP